MEKKCNLMLVELEFFAGEVSVSLAWSHCGQGVFESTSNVKLFDYDP